jgi:hypothetical protein
MIPVLRSAARAYEQDHLVSPDRAHDLDDDSENNFDAANIELFQLKTDARNTVFKRLHARRNFANDDAI